MVAELELALGDLNLKVLPLQRQGEDAGVFGAVSDGSSCRASSRRWPIA